MSSRKEKRLISKDCSNMSVNSFKKYQAKEQAVVSEIDDDVYMEPEIIVEQSPSTSSQEPIYYCSTQMGDVEDSARFHQNDDEEMGAQHIIVREMSDIGVQTKHVLNKSGEVQELKRKYKLLVSRQNDAYVIKHEGVEDVKRQHLNDSFVLKHDGQEEAKRQNLSKSYMKNEVQEFKATCDRLLPANLSTFVKCQVDYSARSMLEDISNEGLNRSRKNKTRKNYTVEFEQAILSLYFSRPKMYGFIAKNFHLPSYNKLKNVVSNWRFAPGIQDSLFDSLKIKTKFMTQVDKQCIITMGEVPLRAKLFYNISKDEVIGLEDLGRGSNYKVANRTLIVMAQGLASDWKQPLGYFFLNYTCHVDDLKDILIKTIFKTDLTGLNVVAVVTDITQNFIELSNILLINPTNISFTINHKKILFLFDPVQLLKATRNNMLAYTYHFDDKVTSWDHFSSFYGLDKDFAMRMAPKITHAHVFPSKEDKGKWKLAADVFSERVAIGIQAFVRTGELPDEALGTAEFLHRIGALFNILHAKSTIKQAYIGSRSQTKFLDDTFKWLGAVRVCNAQDEDITHQIKSISFWQTTIQSMRKLWLYLEHVGFNCLQTKRLSCGKFRQMCTTINDQRLRASLKKRKRKTKISSNPTPIQFVNAFKQVYRKDYLIGCSKLPRSDYSDLNTLLSHIGRLIASEQMYSSELSVARSMNVHGIVDYRLQHMLQRNHMKCVCGYLLKKCRMAHAACENCQYLMGKVYNSNENELTNESHATHARFSEYISKLEKVFLEVFDEVITQPQVLQSMISVVRRVPICITCRDFPKEFMLKLFLRLQLFHTLKLVNQELRRMTKKNENDITSAGDTVATVNNSC